MLFSPFPSLLHYPSPLTQRLLKAPLAKPRGIYTSCNKIQRTEQLAAELKIAKANIVTLMWGGILLLLQYSMTGSAGKKMQAELFFNNANKRLKKKNKKTAKQQKQHYLL